jgi:putative ABC transport system permease protein
MNNFATLRIALNALRVNKLRSALTMLGVIIGVAAVITMLAVGAGAEARIQEQIKSLGSNLMIVTAGARTASGVYDFQLELRHHSQKMMLQLLREIFLKSKRLRHQIAVERKW